MTFTISYDNNENKLNSLLNLPKLKMNYYRILKNVMVECQLCKQCRTAVHIVWHSTISIADLELGHLDFTQVLQLVRLISQDGHE